MGVRIPEGVAGVRVGWLAVCTGEFGDQGDLAFGLNLGGQRSFLFPGGLQELATLGVAFRPDLGEKITIAITVENQF